MLKFLEFHMNREIYQPMHSNMLYELFMSVDKSYEKYLHLCTHWGIMYVRRENYPFHTPEEDRHEECGV